MDGDPQLFGSMPGPVTRCELTIVNPTASEAGHVWIGLYSQNRKRPMEILVSSLATGEIGAVLGHLTPVMQQSHYASTAKIRRSMWAVFRKLGADGREVALNGCGRLPT